VFVQRTKHAKVRNRLAIVPQAAGRGKLFLAFPEISVPIRLPKLLTKYYIHLQYFVWTQGFATMGAWQVLQSA
jgi:hypothetical protein